MIVPENDQVGSMTKSPIELFSAQNAPVARSEFLKGPVHLIHAGEKKIPSLGFIKVPPQKSEVKEVVTERNT